MYPYMYILSNFYNSRFAFSDLNNSRNVISM